MITGYGRHLTYLDPACGATAAADDDGTWRTPHDSAPILDHAHTPRYPFGAPQPGNWSFHS